MAKRFGFFNSINGDRKYLATDLSQAFDVGISTGLKADNADNFKIVPNTNMQVKMLPGGAMIFGHYILDEEEELINLDPAHAELNRIDRVVLRYDKFERNIKMVVIKGTPALTPVAPAAIRTNEQFDLVLADVYVGKAVTSITTANITDMRESELCGFIGVKGAVSQIDFDSHLIESTSELIVVQRQVGLNGIQTIATTRKAKSITIFSKVTGNNIASFGFFSPGMQRSISYLGSELGFYSHSNYNNSSIAIATDASNYFKGTIGAITDTKFDIVWESSGAAPVGNTVDGYALVTYHGRD